MFIDMQNLIAAERHLAKFIEVRCIVRPTAFAGRMMLYDAYERWCRQRDEKAVSFEQFKPSMSRELRRRGCVEKIVRTDDGKETLGFLGVAVRGNELRLDGMGVLRAA